MKRKIKLTEKDLKIEVRSSEISNSVPERANTEVPDCKTTTLGLTCPTATFRTVCLSRNPTCDCGDPATQRYDCYDTGNNCANPVTAWNQCGHVTYQCDNSQDTCYCVETTICIDTQTDNTNCTMCESGNDCQISDECAETDVCANISIEEGCTETFKCATENFIDCASDQRGCVIKTIVQCE